MSFYVHRSSDNGREGWVGPIRSAAQADREVAAWEEAGWRAVRLIGSPMVKAEVARWQRAADVRLGRVR